MRSSATGSGLEVGHAEIGPNERLQAGCLERRADRLQGTAHEAQVHATYDALAAHGKRSERASAQVDGGGAIRCVRREAGIVEQLDHPLHAVRGTRGGGEIDGEAATPSVTGGRRLRARIGAFGKLLGQHPGQGAIRLRIVVAGVRIGPEAQRRPAATTWSGRLLEDEAGIEQLLEMGSNGVRVEADRIRQVADAEWLRRRTEDGEQPRARGAGERAMAHRWGHACIITRSNVEIQAGTPTTFEETLMSMSDEEAVAAIRTHHAELQSDLRARVTALENSVRRGEWHGDVQRSLLEYLDGELLPHASAEERALYPAGDSGLTALLVRAMRDEHRTLIAHVSELRAATDAVTVATTAAAILALFESHLTKENDLLLPALAADASVDVGSLLAGMHELVG